MEVLGGLEAALVACCVCGVNVAVVDVVDTFVSFIVSEAWPPVVAAVETGQVPKLEELLPLAEPGGELTTYLSRLFCSMSCPADDSRCGRGLSMAEVAS